MATFTTRPTRRKVSLPVKQPNGHDGHDGVVDLRVDAVRLYRELAAAVAGEVRFGNAARGLYATDSSNFRQVPLGVVLPRNLDDVVRTHAICARYGVPILNRGGGSSLSGETVNFAVVVDNSKYLTTIGEVDRARRLVTCETGVINEILNKTIGHTGLVFGPDPSSHAFCTIGGNLGNNSCGIHSVQSQLFGPGPRTSDNVHAMEICTYDGARFWVGVGEERELDRIIAAGGRKGEIYRQLRALRDRYAEVIRKVFPPVDELPRRVSGYNLDELLPERGFNVARALVGTESTCATALQVTLMLTPAMLERQTVFIEYDDICDAVAHIGELMKWKPIGLEGVDNLLFEDEEVEGRHKEALDSLPRPGAHAWLYVQLGSDSADETQAKVDAFYDWLVGKMGYERDRIKISKSAQQGGDSARLWEVREGGLGATAFPPDGKDHWPGWEDSAVPPRHTAGYARDLKQLYKKYGYRGAIYGHLAQGCVHSRISFDLRTADGIKHYRAFMNEAADLCVSYGGSLSGEHGDGQQRAELLVKQYGPEIVEAMRQFKRIWDPEWRMNPGKVIDPYPMDVNLKLGADYNPPRPHTKFAYTQDKGDFAHATLRCVGAGRCRKVEGDQVMCPSFYVTRDEKHTTRGRARLLFEMLQGEVITDGWKSQEVYDALDLCLACKGCTNDCPVSVDMPTLKSEFLYHHFAGLTRNRKRYMYAFGFIDKLARLASLFPEAFNWAARAPGVSTLAKLAAGLDRRRQIPTLAPLSLQSWFRRRGGSRVRSDKKVVLWPDTFNNYFHAQVGVACVEALEAAGWRVVMPLEHVCCGRPLYDYGFLDVAERYLRRTLRQLRDEIRQGTPVVGMEPSCLAVFKDELANLLPHDDDGKRLRALARHFPDFFAEEKLEVPGLRDLPAVVWGHCHHKATGGMKSELALLGDEMGMKVEEAQGGCCGLAGSWGFEQGKHDISYRCGEVGFLPGVRKAPIDALIVADGFSCKTQLEQSDVDRVALHTGEVMKLARERGPAAVAGPRPELLRSPPPPAPRSLKVARAAVLAGAAAAAATLAVVTLARWRRR